MFERSSSTCNHLVLFRCNCLFVILSYLFFSHTPPQTHRRQSSSRRQTINNGLCMGKFKNEEYRLAVIYCILRPVLTDESTSHRYIIQSSDDGDQGLELISSPRGSEYQSRHKNIIPVARPLAFVAPISPISHSLPSNYAFLRWAIRPHEYTLGSQTLKLSNRKLT